VSWASTLGTAFLTAIAGGASAIFLTYKCIEWYRLQTHDGGDLGYFLVFVPLGLICGFMAGAVISRFVSGFWLSSGVSIGGLVVLCAIGAFVARMYGEIAPRLDGDELVLQVELRSPAGWQPDNDARRAEGRSCRLQPLGPGNRAGTPIYGNLDWRSATQSDGQWIVPCAVKLISSRENRLVQYTFGKEWIEFNLNLPRNPTAENKVWSAWITEGFSQEVGKPPKAGFAYRCRVKGVQQLRDEADAVHNAFWQQREDAAKAITADDPIERWLPLFEDPGGVPSAYRWGGADRIERRSVAARVLELAQPLASKDKTVVRQAVFALGSLYETPRALVPPLLAAGRLTLDYIQEAKSQPQTEEPSDAARGTKALQYFDMWSRAVKNAGPVEAPELRTLLADIQRETAGLKDDLWILNNNAKEFQHSLPPVRE